MKDLVGEGEVVAGVGWGGGERSNLSWIRILPRGTRNAPSSGLSLCTQTAVRFLFRGCEAKAGIPSVFAGTFYLVNRR